MSHYRKHYPKNAGAPKDANSSEPVIQPRGPAEQALLSSLFAELFQTEQSASLHSEREAMRLGDIPPAEALRGVAAHASGVLKELPGLAERHHLPVSVAGLALGRFLSASRQLVIDRIVEPERSYRGTLSGMRHGVDVVELIRHAAHAQHNAELETWCTEWLHKRTHLVKRVGKELEWFGKDAAASIGKAPTDGSSGRLVARLLSLIPS